MWHAVAYVLTFPEGLIWPGLRHSWYAVVCATWFPVGLFLFVRAGLEERGSW